MNLIQAINSASGLVVQHLDKSTSYTTTIIGDGQTYLFEINHNVDNIDAVVTVTDINGQTYSEDVICDIYRYSANMLKIGFNEAPAVGVKYRVSVITPSVINPDPEPIALDEPYFGRVFVSRSKEFVKAVDMEVKSIHIPMMKENVDFEYEISTEESRCKLGTYRFTKYYPVGCIMDCDGLKVTVLGYSTPERINGILYSNIEGTLVQTLDGERITDDSVEKRVLHNLTDIVISNDDNKRLLKYYDGNIIDMIGSTVEDAKTALNVFQELYEKDKSITNGYRAQMLDDIEHQEEAQLVSDATAYSTFYNTNSLDLIYKSSKMNINSKSFASWLLEYTTSKPIEDYGRIFKRLFLEGITGNDCRVKYKKYNDSSATIIIYTPGACSYNIACYVDSYTRYLDRITIDCGFAMIGKNYTPGSVTTINFSSVTDADKWKWFGNLFYHATAKGKSASITLTEYYEEVLPVILSYVSAYSHITSATYTRDTIDSGYSSDRNGVLNIDGKTIDI